ncbi:erythrocyte membrane protein 1, PfEMP1, putative [Plasmodium gaboni]|uniref:Erythrocyte membrane protein 1, PfEMP1, putative n=1 Tax=Plasmodium gaboni TaxID=647221 RepID=A0ABY1UVW0_9APIC|nr:erythrocyte membrane protein 1, PfEMP1, putative [Plasmodium gaboni]
MAKTNCGGNKGAVKAEVKTIATQIQAETQEKAKDGGKAGHSNEGELKAELKGAKFGNDLNGSGLEDDDVCKLNIKTHTNDSRTYTDSNPPGHNQHRGPCTGKGTNIFKIGDRWKPADNGHVEQQHNDVLFPPRRLDMCTSNLESLNTNNPGLNDKDTAIHSLLGDVMLSAKTEAEEIIKLYDQSAKSGATSDKDTKCRAMKYSFADLGDIIRGRDMWNNSDMTKLEQYLVKIFEKIKDTEEIKKIGKYNSDNEPYTQLRDDWWTANRDQIWTAMKCGTVTCDSETPLDDYIPQELRWLDEWSHQYCNQRKTLADNVVSECQKCKDASDTYHKNNSGGSAKECGNNSSECGNCNKSACEKCKQACSDYKNFVSSTGGSATNKNDWRKQWKDMNTRYHDLMKKARDEIETKSKSPQNAGGPSGTSTTTTCSGNNQCVDSFFQNLHDKGYTTLSSYISKMSTTDCGGDKHVVATNTCGITYI